MISLNYRSIKEASHRLASLCPLGSGISFGTDRSSQNGKFTNNRNRTNKKVSRTVKEELTKAKYRLLVILYVTGKHKWNELNLGPKSSDDSFDASSDEFMYNQPEGDRAIIIFRSNSIGYNGRSYQATTRREIKHVQLPIQFTCNIDINNMFFQKIQSIYEILISNFQI